VRQDSDLLAERSPGGRCAEIRDVTQRPDRCVPAVSQGSRVHVHQSGGRRPREVAVRDPSRGPVVRDDVRVRHVVDLLLPLGGGHGDPAGVEACHPGFAQHVHAVRRQRLLEPSVGSRHLER
jgi:hypothetical protein